MEIKSLQGTDFDKIFDAFSNAFEDYEVQVNKEEMLTMIRRRGFVQELSFAAFDHDSVVSFTLNGIGTFNGVSTAYDTGTGTVKEYRGRNLASAIFDYSIPYLKAAGIQQYLLEVLQHNTNAVNVYRKIGFEVNRELYYFIKKNEEITFKNHNTAAQYAIRKITFENCFESHSFCDFYPSWQNSFQSIARNSEHFLFFGGFNTNELIGYCILEPASGDITQIAVDSRHRRKGVATKLLAEALKFNRHDSLKIVNTDIRCDSITHFLESVNIPPTGKQFEMIKKL